MKKTVLITVVAAVFVLVAACGQRQSKAVDESDKTEEVINPKINVLSWLRMMPDEFGCMMEEMFGHRDERFNCSLKDYENEGDPCVNYEAYYEGPEFPESLVKKIHPRLKGIGLSWEGGMLQSVWFMFENKPTEEQLFADFGIDPENLPENIYRVDAEEGSLMIEGFLHMGAGDVDCSEFENLHPIDNRMNNKLNKDYSTGGSIQTFEVTTEAWEEELNKNLQTLIENARGDTEKIKVIQAAHDAWLAFRDDEVTFNIYFWNSFSGSMYAPFSPYYQMAFVRQRALDLLCYFDKTASFSDLYNIESDEVKTEEEWDKLLNENYQALMKKLDKENQDRLRVAQRKWIIFRDTDEKFHDYNANVINPEYRSLLVEKRALRLGKYLDDLNEQ
jgi:uncharacterized protein YecT (DUF1311 family)